MTAGSASASVLPNIDPLQRTIGVAARGPDFVAIQGDRETGTIQASTNTAESWSSPAVLPLQDVWVASVAATPSIAFAVALTCPDLDEFGCPAGRAGVSIATLSTDSERWQQGASIGADESAAVSPDGDAVVAAGNDENTQINWLYLDDLVN